jgi:hypothetical protein
VAPLRRRISLLITSAAAVAIGAAVVPLSSSYAAVAAPAPTLVSPANETETAIKDLVLDWKPVAGASSYEVQVSRNEDWTNNQVFDGATKATLFEMPIGLPHSTYFWRVRAKVGSTAGAWSQVWQFFREWEAPIHVVHTPSSADPTVTWAPVPEASIYHVIFDTSPISNQDLLDVNGGGCFTANTSFTAGTGGDEQSTNGFTCDDPSLQDGKTYYWGLAAFDDTTSSPIKLQGTEGCGTELPECDALVVNGGSFLWHAPASGTGTQLTGLKTTWHSSTDTQNVCTETTPCPMTPTFSWEPVPGADLYLLEIYVDRDATTLYRGYNSQTPTITPPDQFQDAQPNKPYYWRVDASTCGGTGVQCTAPKAANQGCPPPGGTTSATPSPAPSSTPAPAPTVTGVKVSPVGPDGDQSMQGGTTATVTLTGTGIASGACVSASGGVVTTVPSVVNDTMSFGYYAPVPGGSVTFTIENPDGKTSGTSSAITVDSSAHSVALSALQLFQKRSGPVTLRSPAAGAVLNGNTITFKWDDYIASGSQGSYDPKNYELQVAHDSNFSNIIADITDIDLTQYTSPDGFTGAGPLFWRVNATDESGNLLTWSNTRTVTVNSIRPTVKFTSESGVRVTGPLTIQFSHLVNGVNRSTLKVVPAGKSVSHALAGTLHRGASPTVFVFTPKHPLATGGSYSLWASHALVDVNHNHVLVSDTSLRAKRRAHNRSKGWHFDAGWSRHRSSGSFSGSDMEGRAGSTASIRIQGENVQIAACKGPQFGSISFRVAGISHTVNEHQSFTNCGVYVWRTALPAGIHTLHVQVVSGTGNIDSLAVR